ncbi:outer membrane beta-barrel protein [Castellaniella daejeonensis]|jgi:outer membrane protein|uniref:Outer membrane beta-barrel protein n=1 Tax=Castellaniella daejeonensis TaxID=659013 RepID=A0ABP3D4B0_9BURK
MAFRLRHTVLACTLAAGTLAAGPALAHEAGDILLKVGVTHVEPKSDNGTVANGAVKLDIDGSTRPSFTLTYMATRNIGIELLGAYPFKHTINAKGLGDIGSTQQLPPTLSLQWHFLPDAAFQPYVGVGLNYTTFFDTNSKLGNLSLDDSWGVAAQVGVDYKLNDRWFLNADLRYIDISSNVRLNGADIGKTRINPWVATVGVGYRF